MVCHRVLFCIPDRRARWKIVWEWKGELTPRGYLLRRNALGKTERDNVSAGVLSGGTDSGEVGAGVARGPQHGDIKRR